MKNFLCDGIGIDLGTASVLVYLAGKGIVSPEHTCPKFELNYLRIQPKRARKPDTSKLKPEDFSLE